MTFSMKAIILRFFNINTILFLYNNTLWGGRVLVLTRSLSISSVCLSVLLAPNYGHTPIFIVVRFEILVLGTKAA